MYLKCIITFCNKINQPLVKSNQAGFEPIPAGAFFRAGFIVRLIKSIQFQSNLQHSCLLKNLLNRSVLRPKNIQTQSTEDQISACLMKSNKYKFLLRHHTLVPNLVINSAKYLINLQKLKEKDKMNMELCQQAQVFEEERGLLKPRRLSRSLSQTSDSSNSLNEEQLDDDQLLCDAKMSYQKKRKQTCFTISLSPCQ